MFGKSLNCTPRGGETKTENDFEIFLTFMHMGESCTYSISGEKRQCVGIHAHPHALEESLRNSGPKLRSLVAV